MLPGVSERASASLRHPNDRNNQISPQFVRVLRPLLIEGVNEFEIGRVGSNNMFTKLTHATGTQD